MGTSAAYVWATIFFEVHETQALLPTYGRYLIVYKHCTDDIFRIWLPIDNHPDSWEKFKRNTNNFGILEWEFEKPTTSVNILDLTISTENNKIVTKTYQKSTNLFQYIMPQSAHPPNMEKDIITRLLRIYYRKNTKMADYKAMAILLFHRWVRRGWSRVNTKEYTLNADIKVRSECHLTPTTTHTPTESHTNKERVFIHWISR